ncbi:MAG: hypothetical protein V8T45_07765 [Oscillospiraceae bacterium]
MRRILIHLGFTMEGDIIHVPSWRGDVEHYSDIAEEVARFYGYNEIPTCFAGGNTTSGGFTPVQQCERPDRPDLPQPGYGRDNHLFLYKPQLLRQDKNASASSP